MKSTNENNRLGVPDITTSTLVVYVYPYSLETLSWEVITV